MGIRTPEPPRLWRVTRPGPAASAASSLSLPAASPPAPPRCRSEEDAPRVRAAAPAAASLQHRLTAASAAGPAPQARALDKAALTDERRSQCRGAEAAWPRLHRPAPLPRAGPRHPGPGASERPVPLAGFRPGARAPHWQALSPAPVPFLEAQVPALSPRGLGPRAPHSRPEGLWGSAQGRDEPKRSLWAPTGGTQRAEPAWDPGRGAPCWLCPGAARTNEEPREGGPCLQLRGASASLSPGLRRPPLRAPRLPWDWGGSVCWDEDQAVQWERPRGGGVGPGAWGFPARPHGNPRVRSLMPVLPATLDSGKSRCKGRDAAAHCLSALPTMSLRVSVVLG